MPSLEEIMKNGFYNRVFVNFSCCPVCAAAARKGFPPKAIQNWRCLCQHCVGFFHFSNRLAAFQRSSGKRWQIAPCFDVEHELGAQRYHGYGIAKHTSPLKVFSPIIGDKCKLAAQPWFLVVCFPPC